MNRRPTLNPYVAFQPHARALARSGIQYVGGAPVGFAPQAQVGGPFLHVPPFNLGSGPQPVNPLPQDPPSSQGGPVKLNLPLLESSYVQQALALEVQGMKQTIGEMEFTFQNASNAWHKARTTAFQIGIEAAASGRTVAADNASVRLTEYDRRSQIDADVASGKRPHPVVSGEVTNPDLGWSWPEIPQKSSSGANPNLNPNPTIDPNPDLVPRPDSGAASSGGLLALLALAAAAAYAAVKIFKR